MRNGEAGAGGEGGADGRMEGDVLNDRERGGEESVHSRQHSEKTPAGPTLQPPGTRVHGS